MVGTIIETRIDVGRRRRSHPDPSDRAQRLLEEHPMADAGWYDDGSGRLRWWDGHQWTEHFHTPGVDPSKALATAQATPVSTAARLPDRAAGLLQNASAGRLADAAAAEILPEGTLWAARGQRLSGLSGGRYRLTNEILYFESGTLSLKGQQIATHEIVDVDVSQTMTQKARGLGDIVLTAHRITGAERVVLSDIADFRNGAEIINTVVRDAKRARAEYDVMSKTQRVQTEMHYSGNTPVIGGVAAAASAPAAQRTDLVTEIRKLAELHADGVLDDDEFAAAKRKLLDL
jgi:hypothetical protein